MEDTAKMDSKPLGGILGTFCALFHLFCGLTAVDYSINPAVKNFRTYLQINTTSGTDLSPAVDFWRGLAGELNLPFNVYKYETGKPVVVIKVEGTNPSLPSIMLNSHMDVVPAVESEWTYPPFSAFLDKNNDIWARGSQDMKSVGIQYFEAIRRIKTANIPLLRNVYMTFMPDEENGGAAGMQKFVLSKEFKEMNVGCELDEGLAFPIEYTAVLYQDKSVWRIQVDCHGEAGHGSTLPPTNATAIGKCMKVINTLLNYREQQYQLSLKAPIDDASSYTSVNLNVLKAGTASNVIADQVTAIFDIRPSTSLNLNDFDAQLKQWIAEAGDNVTLTYLEKDPQTPATVVDDSNPFWVAYRQGAQDANITILPVIPPGSTDARHLRSDTVSAFGMSPMANTPLLMHDVNERLNAETFMKGIGVFEAIVKRVANVPSG